MNYQYLLISTILVFTLIGCTPEIQYIEKNCTDTCSTQEPVIEEPQGVPITIYRIDYSAEPVFMLRGNDIYAFDIVNCGSVAYSPLITDKLEEIRVSYDWYDMNVLIITNTADQFIGGCAEIMRRFPDIKGLKIYGNHTDTEAFKEMIKWTPPEKVRYIDGDYSLNLSKYTEEIQEVYLE